MYTYLAIALGGAAGAVSRYWLSTVVERANGSWFPLGTFAVNVIGRFIIGAVFILFAERLSLVDQWRPLVVIGFLGALTTFSTFSLDALLLFQQGHYNTALIYILSSVLVCLFAAFAGMQLARLVL
jgi:fluoride exporter